MSLRAYPQYINNCFVNSVFNLLAHGVNDKNWKIKNDKFEIFPFIINYLNDISEEKAKKAFGISEYNLTRIIRKYYVHPGEIRDDDNSSFGSTDMTFFALVEVFGLQNDNVQFITPKEVPNAKPSQDFENSHKVPEKIDIQDKNFIVASSLESLVCLSNETAFYCLYNDKPLILAKYEDSINAIPIDIYDVITKTSSIVDRYYQNLSAKFSKDILESYSRFLIKSRTNIYKYRVNSLLIFRGKLAKNGLDAVGHYFVISRIGDDKYIIDPANKIEQFKKITDEVYNEYIDRLKSNFICVGDNFYTYTIKGIVLEKDKSLY